MNLADITEISDQTVLGRVLRLPFKLLPPTVQLPVLQGALRGKRWIVGAHNHGCWLGTYEHSVQRAFSAKVKRGYVVFDIGANVGFYSLLASVLVGPKGRVFSFEPAPRNLDFLRAHLNLNKIENCSVWQAAVGRSEGTGYFDLGPNSAMGHLSIESTNTLRVRIVALDDLVSSGQLPPPNLIKFDIEGGEFDALIGAAGTLAKCRPTIFLETHGPDVHTRCCGFLTEIGYRLTSLDKLPLDRTREVLGIHQDECLHQDILPCK